MITRLASDPRTQAYMERRVKDGRSKSEAIRMLKRYVAREVYPTCLAPRSRTMDLAHVRLSSMRLTFTRYAGPWPVHRLSRRRVT